MRAPRALLFALLTALACTPAPPVVADTPRPTAPPPTPSPPPTPTTITVHAAAPGRDPLAVEHDITVPLEQALAGVPGLARLRSESRSDLATLVLTLAPGTASDLARAAVVEQLTAARATLPADILPPTLAPELGPHPVHFLLTGDTVPASELRDLAGRLRSDLSSTPGVATIDLCGGRDAQLQIVLDPARLTALAVPLTAILTSLRTSLQGDTLLAPGLQARVSARSLDDLTHLVVKPGPPAVTSSWPGRSARAPACNAYASKNAAPAQRIHCPHSGRASNTPPMPHTPACSSTASDKAHSATTGNTCSRRKPWRSTNAFCAPMAMMSMAVELKP